MATKEMLEKSQQAVGNFFKLSDYLLGYDAPYDVQEIPEDSEFRSLAEDIVADMGLDWDKVSHDESVKVMLNMLADAYTAIDCEEGYRPVLKIAIEKRG